MQALKQYIKDLAENQKETKRDRKTGTLPERLYNEEWQCHYFPKEMEAKLEKSWKAAGQVQRNKVRITAALNLYHELRETGLSHSFDYERNGHYDSYDKIYQELKERFVPQEV